MIDLYVLTPAVIAQIFNPTEKLEIPTGTPTNEVNAKIEAQLLTAETRTRKRPKKFKILQTFLCFSLI